MLKQVLPADETPEPKSIFKTNLVETAKVSKYYFLFNKKNPVFDDFETATRRVTDSKLTIDISHFCLGSTRLH